MNLKYLTAGLFALFVITGWNVFLVQRDAKLYDAYGYTQQK